MEAAQKLQNGEPSDLIPRLAATGEFGMTEAEMRELLSPENYIGRCRDQVEAFLGRYRGVWEAAAGGSAELNV
jgi:adenylosuccinate lyase